MNYYDKAFKIEENQIKFKNRTFVLFMIIFIPIFTTSLAFSKGNILIASFTIIGGIIGFLFIRLFVGMYLKNTINLSDIDYVKVQTWDKSIDKDRNFWGIGRYKYHFPTGINKQTNPKVIFVHIKERKSTVGFVPENCENTISALRERGIKITEQKSGNG